MLQLENETPFQADRAALVDMDGNQVWVVVVKGTFLMPQDGRPLVAPEQEPVCRSPRYSGAPGESSLLREGELVAEHPGTDISLLGTAHAAEGRPTTSLDVVAAVGPVQKTMRVFGDRVWESDGSALRMSMPAPFLRMPITYERAYGGADPPGPSFAPHEPRNPVGTGFASRAHTLVGRALPNVEDPRLLIQNWKSRPPPAGFGPIPGMWSPRREYAGTFDQAWAEERLPLLPRDYDRKHAQSAHPDLVSQQPLRGGEMVSLINLTEEPRPPFRLPRVSLILRTQMKHGRLLMKPQLDRVILEPDAGKLMMVWRASLNCGSRVRDVVRTTAEVKPYLR